MAKPFPSGWYPRRGEVYLADLGAKKLRPVILLSVNPLNRHALDVCVVPVTSIQHREFSMRVPLREGDGGLQRDSWAKCDQVTTLEKSYLRYPPLGSLLGLAAFENIQEQVRIALGLY